MSHAQDDARAVIARAIAITGLLSIALIHVLDLQSKLEETPYLGVAHIALVIGCVVSGDALKVLAPAPERRRVETANAA